MTHFRYFDNKTQNTRKMQNPIWNNCQNLKNFPTCFFHLKKIFFWFSGYSKFTYFFKKWVKMTNLAWIKKIELLTLIHLPYWALNGIGPMVAEILWNCAEHVESCMVVNFERPENLKKYFFKRKNQFGKFFIFWRLFQMRFCIFFVFCVLLSK